MVDRAVFPGIRVGDELEGRRGRYRIDGTLGQGGSGVVASATDLAGGRKVAVKVMLPSNVTGAARRFLRESEAISRLDCEHIVRVFDTGALDDETPFIVMEFLEGHDLREHLTEHGPLPVAEIVKLVLQALDALAHVHAAGMVHRDVKLRNLFVTQPSVDPCVKLIDFGSSKVPFETPGLDPTRSTDTLGTWSYMAPEQFKTADVDKGADIWAIGVVIYELATGSRPFDDASAQNLAREVNDKLHRPLSGPAAPLGFVVDACLAKAARDRPDAATLAALVAPLAPTRAQAWVAPLLAGASPTWLARRPAWRRSLRRQLAVAGFVVAGAVGMWVLPHACTASSRFEMDAAACIAETDAQLCGKLNANCDAVETTDRCGTARSPQCGSCAAPVTCGADGRPNRCGYAGTFAMALGGSRDESPGAIQQTRDGGYVVVGTTESFGAGARDVWVVRLDPAGRVRWERTYGGPLDEWGWGVAETPDDGLIVSGSTASSGAGDQDAWLIKLDSRGDIDWQRTYGGAGADSFRAVRSTRPAGFVAAGGTGSFGAGNEDIWVVRLDDIGTVQWERTFGGEGTGPDASYADSTWSIEQLSNNGFFIAGDAYLPLSAGHWDGWALKLHPDGEPLWEKTIGGPGREHFVDGRELHDGFIAAGVTQSFGAGGDDVLVVRLDRFGGISWTVAIGSPGQEGGQAAQPTADDGVVVAGSIDPTDSDKDGWLIKLDADGEVVWQQAYGGEGADDLRRLAPTHDGNVVALGSTASWGAGGTDIWVMKVDAEGGLQTECGGVLPAPTGATSSIVTPVVSITSVSGTSALLSSPTEALPRRISSTVSPLCSAGLRRQE